jgi:hypothetical protein
MLESKKIYPPKRVVVTRRRKEYAKRQNLKHNPPHKKREDVVKEVEGGFQDINPRCEACNKLIEGVFTRPWSFKCPKCNRYVDKFE